MTADAAEVLARTRALLDPALRRALARLDVHDRRIADYHLGFADADGASSAAGSGKLIRGTLALLSAEAVLGRDAAAVRVALPAAVGIELVHQYSLLHDDIIDRDVERRHRPAAWTVFGKAETILAGDALAALAIECVFGEAAADGRDGMTAGASGMPSTSGAVALALAVATRRMVAGQAADISFERAAAVELDQCLAMVADKTGALLTCAASVGAIAAGGAAEVIDGLAAFGAHVGLAFQLVDDLIGLWGSGEATGKPVGSDIESRKMSLPVVAALQAGAGDPAAQHAERLAASYAEEGELSAAQIADVLAAIEGAGGRAWAEAEAEAQTNAALAILGDLPIDGDARRDLIKVTDMLCRRTG